MKLVKRNAAPLINECLEFFPITVLQGARQVGKSTLAAMVASEHNAVIRSLDDLEVQAAIDYDILSFLKLNPHGLLVIDEVQLRPELITAIKSEVDKNRHPGRFLLTGSANLLRLNAKVDSLAGRAATVNLRGLSQGELSGQREDFIAKITSGSSFAEFSTKWQREDYVTAMFTGGFPELQQATRRMRRLWLDSYLERVLGRDAHLLPSGGNVRRIEKIAALLAANQAGELVKSRIADQAEIPANSITPYLDALDAIYLVDMLPPWTPNLTQREIGRPKATIRDSALALRLARQSEEHHRNTLTPTVGHFFEGFILSEILKQQTWSEEDYRVFHYRRRNTEVDVIIELFDARIIAIEITSSATFKADFFKNLRTLKNDLGDRMIAGIVLGTGEQAYQYGEGLWGLPAAALWEW